MSRDRTFSKNTVTIPNGGTVSPTVNCGTEMISAIFTPSAWTAGVLGFESSPDGGTTWVPVFDDAGVEVTIASATIVASHVLVDAGILNKLRGLTNFRLASGPAGARVAQGAARDFVVVTKAL